MDDDDDSKNAFKYFLDCRASPKNQLYELHCINYLYNAIPYCSFEQFPERYDKIVAFITALVNDCGRYYEQVNRPKRRMTTDPNTSKTKVRCIQ